MIVELISVGTEIILGNIVNTNANYLSIQCATLGFSLYHQVSVGDNFARLKDAIQVAMNRSDIVILTGGLGPTQDDITKECVAEVVKKPLVMDERSRERILQYFDRKGSGKYANALSKISENNWKQALKIQDCTVLDNNNGTAPGYIVKENHKTLILLPGPPSELIPMFHEKVLPYLSQLQDGIFVSKMVKICGIGESQAETMILDLIEAQQNPTIAPYAKAGEVHFRVTASARTKTEAEELLAPVVKELDRRFQENIYSYDEQENLEDVVVSRLRQKHLSIAAAESCTGGLFTGKLVNVSGASEVLGESIITYSNEAKMKYLGVKQETLNQYGAVSEETAREMALGIQKAANSNLGIGITGIAGPEGGSAEKPVGLIYIACAYDRKVTVNEYRLRGNREKVREQTVVKALDMIRRIIL